MSSQLTILIIAVVVMDSIGMAAAFWVLRDARQRSDEAFRAVGSNRQRWLFWLPVSGALLGVGAIVAASIYALRVRPRLQEAGVPA